MSRRERCAGAIVFDQDGRVLLVRRAHAPDLGSWSVPGGRCRPAEPSQAACVREVAEETGLTVSVIRLAGRVQRTGPGATVYEIDDYVCAVVGGELRAGDDASEVRWATRAELTALPTSPGLVAALTEWDVLPA